MLFQNVAKYWLIMLHLSTIFATTKNLKGEGSTSPLVKITSYPFIPPSHGTKCVMDVNPLGVGVEPIIFKPLIITCYFWGMETLPSIYTGTHNTKSYRDTVLNFSFYASYVFLSCY